VPRVLRRMHVISLITSMSDYEKHIPRKSTCIYNDNFSFTSRHDILVDCQHYAENHISSTAHLKVGGMSHDQPPNANVSHHLVHLFAKCTSFLFQSPATVPHRSICPIQCMFLRCGVVRKTRVWIWWMWRRLRLSCK
jgi:hypothetical protein